MPNDSLRLVVIVGKGLRAGLSFEQSFRYATLLATLARVPLDQVTGSTRITLADLTRAGIRLHPLHIPGIYP